jgi:hypothetical protein
MECSEKKVTTRDAGEYFIKKNVDNKFSLKYDGPWKTF